MDGRVNKMKIYIYFDMKNVGIYKKNATIQY